MSTLVYVLWSLLAFILAISPLVVLHELGHYAVGRVFGVKADVFSIGFGRSLIGFTDKRGTRWQIASLPIGGYVRFAGDMSAASQQNDDWLKLPADERNRTFQSKPLWQRALIILAGPMANFAVAIVGLSVLLGVYGEQRLAPVAASILPGSPAMQMGLRVGDRIVAVEGHPIERFDDIALLVQVRSGLPTAFTIQRGQARFEQSITPRRTSTPDITGATVEVGQIGFGPGVVEVVPVPLVDMPAAGVRYTARALRMTAVGLGQVIFGQRPLTQFGGPVKIARVAGAMTQYGVGNFIGFMMLLSINLGFINLLPIPILDGGHLAFYAVEAVRRKPMGLVAQEWVYRGALVALFSLMLFVTVNDLGLLRGLAGLIG